MVIAYCDLLTLVSVIQKALNSHPLTYRSSSDKELDIIVPVNFISFYIKERLMLKAAEEESTTFTNPPSNSEIVNSLQLRENLLRKIYRFYYDECVLIFSEQCKSIYYCEFENKIKVVDIVYKRNTAKISSYCFFRLSFEFKYGR